MTKYIVALGELLIDFIQIGISKNNNPCYEANPGGAPCNVLAMANKLGIKTSFIGKVGNDKFGTQLENTLIEQNINTEGLTKSDFEPTTLAFVHHDENNDRSFTFYRENCADTSLKDEDVKDYYFKKCDIFHFGTLSMTNDDCKKATLKAINIAKENKAIISFDPNLRENLWDDESNAKNAFDLGLRHCNILKIADNEIKWFTSEDNLDKAITIIKNKYDIDLIFLTLGKDGSKAYYKDIEIKEPTFLNVKCVDTTGAGDSFMGSCLYKILEYGLSNLDKKKLHETLIFANAAASLVASKKGVIKSLPSKNEILKLVNS